MHDKEKYPFKNILFKWFEIIQILLQFFINMLCNIYTGDVFSNISHF